MKLFADECVYAVTINTLRGWGHDTVTAQEVGFSGHADEELLAYAVAHRRILITIDLDFSNLRRYIPESHYGIIVMKVRPSILKDVHFVLAEFLNKYSEDEIHRTLTIIDKNRYRIRK